MTTHGSWSADEWATLFQAPVMAGMVVMLAGKSGPIQLTQELFAVGSAIAEADRTSQNSLVKEIAAAVKAGEKPAAPSQPKSIEEARAQASDHLRAVAALVDARLTPAEAGEFKHWLVDVSEKVAAAAKEGGFLGFGGTQVTEEERAAMAAVASALGVSGASNPV
jgi:hypothetical protein